MKRILKLSAISAIIGLLTYCGLILSSQVYTQGVLDGQLVACNKSLAVNDKAGIYELYCEQRGKTTYLRSGAVKNLEIKITSLDDVSDQ